MRRPDEIMLMAYADGALAAHAAEELEAELRLDLELRASVAMFRQTRVLTQLAFDRPMWDDPPASLLVTVAGPAPADRRRSFWQRTGLHAPDRFLRPAMAVTMAATLAVGILQTRDASLPPGEAVSVGPVAPGSHLERALNATRGNDLGQLHWRFTLVATLKDKLGNLCKELDLFDTGRNGIPAHVLVACQSAGGGWTVIGAVRPKGIGPSPTEPYAKTEDGAHAALSGVLEMMGASQRSSALQSESKQQ